MLLDVVRVEYDKPKDEKSKNRKIKPNDKSITLNEESVRKSLEKRKQQEWIKMPFSDLKKLNTTNTTT